MASLDKSTIVRLRNHALRGYFHYVGPIAPRAVGRTARDLWFTAPPRMAELPVPEGGEAFAVESQGHQVRGLVWGDRDAPTVYLVHGWGGRGSQLAAMVGPLVETGHGVVMVDLPAHGASDHGPAGPRRTHGVEFARALDAVFCRFGPARAVVAHSMGTITTYLALRYGWLGTERLVLVAPMVAAEPLFEPFQRALGFGPRVRRAFDRAVDEFVGVPVAEFDARVQASHVDPVPTLVVADRDDRQAPYAGVVDLAQTLAAPLVTTSGLGHRRILHDPTVVAQVVAFVAGDSALHRIA
jgi:pimeloyl-ACP methyl ester carboxylesterase